MDTVHSNLLEALKQVERRTEFSASGWRLLLYAMVLGPLMVIAPGYFFGVLGRLNAAAVSLISISVSLLLFAFYFGLSARARTRSLLIQSSIAERVASGELIDDPIFQFTPWPWVRLLPGLRDRSSTSDVVRRVAWNLDWYLATPRSLFRLSWIYFPLLILPITFLATLVDDVFAWIGGRLVQDPLKVGAQILLVFVFLSPAIFLHYRREIWTEELVRHLRERLEA